MELKEALKDKELKSFLAWYLAESNKKEISYETEYYVYTKEDCDEIAEYYNQPFDINRLVRPDKPNRDDYQAILPLNFTEDYIRDLSAWENWQCMFKVEGEFETWANGDLIYRYKDRSKGKLLGKLSDFKTNEDIINKCIKLGIKIIAA